MQFHNWFRLHYILYQLLQNISGGATHNVSQLGLHFHYFELGHNFLEWNRPGGVVLTGTDRRNFWVMHDPFISWMMPTSALSKSMLNVICVIQITSDIRRAICFNALLIIDILPLVATWEMPMGTLTYSMRASLERLKNVARNGIVLFMKCCT